MPLLTITLKGEELIGSNTILLERPYKFKSVKLAHIYHNIDSINFNQAKDKLQQANLFLRLGGLIDDSHRLINYSGTFKTMKSVPVQKMYSNDDEQLGQGTLNVDRGKTSEPTASIRQEADIDVNHLVPIGASRHNSHELISRDLFKTLHEGSILNFTGELTTQLFYVDRLGNVEGITSSTGPVISVLKSQPITFMTLVFDYTEEL